MCATKSRELESLDLSWAHSPQIDTFGLIFSVSYNIKAAKMAKMETEAMEAEEA